ncbi:hypothetical protein AALO_G00160050 [Alosa alosa]|uniref:C2H2-type domain-containing protein n=1 Tax=Alosa alosa TaxID=278164 RepID=A0AAV6GAU7_9TELE|nr:hypothetical protein AALO_G00160050 [Alosa alosa]
MSAQEVPNPGLDQGEAASTQDTPTPSPSPSAIKTEPVTTPATPTPVPTATPTPASNGKASESGPPAEICVVIGGSRSAQAQGSYVCGICGKKYKYYNCFQTHVRAHRESEGVSGDGASPVVNNSFRYTCDVCGKNTKNTVDGRDTFPNPASSCWEVLHADTFPNPASSCFQEAASSCWDLHAVDGKDTFSQTNQFMLGCHGVR